MVRGSGRDPEDSEKAKSYYDGSVAKWPAGSMKLKSSLYKAGLWNVVKHGPTPKTRIRPRDIRTRQLLQQAQLPHGCLQSLRCLHSLLLLLRATSVTCAMAERTRVWRSTVQQHSSTMEAITLLAMCAISTMTGMSGLYSATCGRHHRLSDSAHAPTRHTLAARTASRGP